MSSGKQLEQDILTAIREHDGPMPTRQLLHHCVQFLRHPQAEVLGMLGDMIGRDAIKCRPSGEHGAVYEVVS